MERKKAVRAATSSKASSLQPSSYAATEASQASDVARHPSSRRAEGAVASVQSYAEITPQMIAAGVWESLDVFPQECADREYAVMAIFRAMQGVRSP